jgi:hypothetical protein
MFQMSSVNPDSMVGMTLNVWWIRQKLYHAKYSPNIV